MINENEEKCERWHKWVASYISYWKGGAWSVGWRTAGTRK